jgi:hypothetical protein
MNDNCQIEDINTFVATVGCHHAKFGACPPFRLRDFVEGWLQAGIPLNYALGRIKGRLVTDAELVRLDHQIRTGWHELSRPPRAQPRQTSRLFRRIGNLGNGNEPATGRESKPAATKFHWACSFLMEELGGGEIEANALERATRDAGLALRTVDRARKKLGVISRRSGFGRSGRCWLSLPRAPSA